MHFFLNLKMTSESVVVQRGFFKFPEISKCNSSQEKDFIERRRKLWLKLVRKLTLLMYGEVILFVYTLIHHFVLGY